MTARDLVTRHDPTAWAVRSRDTGLWKIYGGGTRYVALSASASTKDAAWADAAAAIRERERQQQGAMA